MQSEENHNNTSGSSSDFVINLDLLQKMSSISAFSDTSSTLSEEDINLSLKKVELDLKKERLEKAKEFGADCVWNPSELDVVDEIMKLTDGYGCDIYIEATGHPDSVSQGLEMIRKLGRFVEFSVFSKTASIDWSVIGDGKELDVLGSHLSPYCFPFVIENINSGNLKTDGIVESFFELKDWEKAFEHATGKYGDFKVAFRF